MEDGRRITDSRLFFCLSLFNGKPQATASVAREAQGARGRSRLRLAVKRCDDESHTRNISWLK